MLKNGIKDHFAIILAKLGLDGVAFGIAFIASYYFCFTIKDAHLYLQDIGLLIPVIIIIRIAIYGYFKLYSQMWRYTSVYALINIIKAASIGTIAIIVVGHFTGYWTPPRSVLVMDWLLVVFLTGSIRLVRRSFLDSGLRLFKFSKKNRNVLIYGAGKAGETLFRNIQSSSTIDVKIIGFIDDNPALHGQYIHDKKILGDRNALRSLVDKYNIDSIYIAIPRLSGHENRELLKIIRENTDDIQVMTIPGLKDLVDGKVTVNQIRSFNIKDLLRRQPVNLDFTPVKELMQGKTVMVVGGGGSIGSELCYQIAQFAPEKILIIDNCELNCYNIEDGLRNKFPSQEINCILADACNEAYMRMIFDRYRPEIVFHAAAYKHVPLVEVNPWAAISNNIQCTLTLTKLSEEFRIDRFIMISTDKAVRPQGIMGATKRICELITLFRFDSSVTKFIAVRFGNVLGSSGSVIHKFKHQIEQGGPVTVTDPEVSRYFMLISEAVELVLQAGAIGRNGEIYVLDMGEPIKIAELAKYMIEFSGFKVGKEIEIVYTGLRKGEKFHESLFFEGEENSTEVPSLFVLRQTNHLNNEFFNEVHSLLGSLYKYDSSELKAVLKNLAPDFQPQEEVG